MLCVQDKSSSMSPIIQNLMTVARAEIKRAHPKSFTRPLEDAVIVPSSSTVYSAEMLSWRKRPSGSFLARAYHFPAYCHESVLISGLATMVRLAQKLFWSKCLSNFPLPDECQSEFGWECSTQTLQCCPMNPCLCARRSGSSSSALLCLCSPCQGRNSCHSDPTPKASPILRHLLRVRLVPPCSCSSPFSSMEYHTKSQYQITGTKTVASWLETISVSCGCHRPQLISDGEKRLPSKAESDDYILKTQGGCVGECNSREK